MSVEILTLLLFVCTIALLAVGVHIAFALGGVAVVFAIAFWGFDHLSVIAIAGFSTLQNINLIAIPLFILMGWIIYKSGIAEDLFEALHVWAGGVRGGLAIGTVAIGAVFGAICGDLLAAIFTVTTLALPQLLKRGYDKHLAIGCVIAGSTLALIIPPSISIIIFSSITGQSVGRMYLACFVPGFLLAVLYMLYIGIRCYLRPAMGPPAPPEIRASWGIKIAKLKGVVLPLALLLSMLIGIYSGAFTPMEASGVGVAGAFVCAAIKRRLTWSMVWEAVSMTLRITCMIGWMFLAIGCFTAVYAGIGALDLASNMAAAVPGQGLPVIIIMQLFLIIFGMFLDDVAIIMIFGPIFLSVVASLGFDTLWYGALFMVNMQLAFSTPPYGFALFAMRAVLPTIPELKPFNISMGDIYRAAIPFIGLQALTLVLILIFQPLATFLPSLLIR